MSFNSNSALFFLLGFFSLGAIASPGKIVNIASKHAIPNHYIVVLNDNVPLASGATVENASPQALDALAKQMVSTYGGRLTHTYHTVLHGFSAVLSPKVAMKLTKNQKVSWIEQVVEVHGTSTEINPPADLDRVDQRSRGGDGRYDYDTTASNVYVYIIGSGIRLTHLDFGGRAKAGVDEVSDGHGVDDCTSSGHGTRVAGIVGGHTYGVAKGVTLYAVRVLGCSGSGSSADVIDGVDWVTQHHQNHPNHPAVANISLGGPPSPAEDTAVRNAISNGVSIVISAGNDNNDACNYSPARVAQAIVVGAIDSNDHRAISTNLGFELRSLPGFVCAWRRCSFGYQRQRYRDKYG